MRLPKIDDVIDVEQVKVMVDHFMEAGFTYFDTAWAYNGSEEAARKALVERYPRDSYTLASKLAAWQGEKTKEAALKQLDTSLERSGAGYFDYYLLHNLGAPRTHFFDDFGLWDYIQEKKAEGKIRNAGFSFHSTPDVLDELLNAHPEVDFVQLQINYADWNDPSIAARGNYEVARRHGKPVVIMEPVKGGILADPPQMVKSIMKEAEPDSSYASWAIRFAASLEGVITVLSGMSNIEQMDDNISYMKDFTALTPAQDEVLQRVLEEFRKVPLIPCTACNYCAKVCPMDIGVSGTFTAMNDLTLYGSLEHAQGREKWLVGGHGRVRAANCVECGQCMDVCPQHIEIPEELKKVVKALQLA